MAVLHRKTSRAIFPVHHPGLAELAMLRSLYFIIVK
jgi:hypothetical protein